MCVLDDIHNSLLPCLVKLQRIFTCPLRVAYAEPYQPDSIPPNWGAHVVTGAQYSGPSPLSSPKKALTSQIEI